jgi:ABC-2 type transport system ATP-binding protein
MASNETVISISNVSKKFGRFKAVNDISITIHAGEVVGFVGVNGAGKTTTINMLLGFTSPTHGEIKLFGQKVHPSNAHKSHRNIGYVAGDMELPGRMTGRQYVDFVLSQSDGDHTERYEQLIKAFSPQLDKKIRTLSRGNKQKIALVAAFVTEPSLVILDEPSSGLDPIMQEAFLDLVREEREKGTTVFMSSHYLQEVGEVCSRVMLMKNGALVKDLSSKEIEATSGKHVRVVTKRKVLEPKTRSSDVMRENDDDKHTLTFVYDGPTNLLQKWLSGVVGLIDFDISERTLEAAFRGLYADSSEEPKK